MSRPRRHASSLTVALTARVSPDHRERLDTYCRSKGWSRGVVLERLIDRLTEGQELKQVVPPVNPQPTTVLVTCAHKSVYTLSSGITRCRDCGAVKGLGGWPVPLGDG